MKNITYCLLISILYLLSACKTEMNIKNEELVQEIKAHNYQQIKKWVDNGLDMDIILNSDSLSPLVLSIQEQCPSISKSIIEQGVKLESGYMGNTPLHWAIKCNQGETASLLIQKQVNLNAVNHEGYTPLHLAIMNSEIDVVQELVNNGCNITQADSYGNTALNFAIVTGNDQLIDCLLSNGAIIYKNNLPETMEGPHIKQVKNGLVVEYLKHSARNGYSSVIEAKYPKETDSIQAWFIDSSYYHITKIRKPSSEYKGVEKIFVLGDIHGQYDRMIKNLKSNHVIDENKKWNFGKGHLVFVGDIMDRGGKVTECLWFIYNLERQAEKHGGKVHLILGNHEYMVFKNDLRYIAEKYEKLYKNLGISYSDHFKGNYVMSKWLRSKNTVLKINDILFVHAGISNDFAAQQYSLDDINKYTRNYLKAGTNTQNEEMYKLFLGSKGPVWYRGYFKKSSKYPKMTQHELEKILNQYKVSTIIVGHTEVDTLKAWYNGAVIDVNIPLWNDKVPNQALLINSNEYYRLEEGKKPVRLK